MKSRKIVSVFLAVCMLLSMLPMTAFADNSVVMPQKDVCVTAASEPGAYNSVHVDIGNENYHTDRGRVEIDGGVTGYYYEGDVVTVNAVPYDHYVTASWVVLMRDELTDEYTYAVPHVAHPDPNTITFPMPAERVTVYAVFSELHDLLVFSPDTEGGTVVPDKPLVNSMASPEDKIVTLTIQPANGYRYIPGTLRIVEVDEQFHESELEGYAYRVAEVTENSVYTVELDAKSVFVYARFEQAPEQPKYTITVDDETAYGTVSADYALAEEGWTVTLTTSPETHRGYVTKSVTVADENGTTYPTTDLGDHRFSFTMPAKDVFVTATFSIPSYAISTAVVGDASEVCEIEVEPEAEVGDLVNIFVSLRPETTLEALTVAGNTTGRFYETVQTYHSGSSYYYRFTMPSEPVTVNACFSDIRYPLTVNDAVEGTMTFSVNGGANDTSAAAKYGDTVTVTYTYANTAGTTAEVVDNMTYSYSINGNTAKRPLENQTHTGNVHTGTLIMPSADVEIGVDYVSPFFVTIDTSQIAGQNGSVDAVLGGIAHSAVFRAFPGEVIRLFAFSDLSDKVRATWHVTFTDETGEHETEVTRVSDSIGDFTMPAASVTVRAELEALGVPYIIRGWDAENKTVTEQLRYRTDYTNVSSITGSTISSGWYVLDSSRTLNDRLTVSGNVHLILRDDLTLTCTKGVRVPNGATLRIYGQRGDSGKLSAIGDEYNAGIGSNDEDEGAETSAGAVVIHGGTIAATGGSDAAGIGGGNESHGGPVTIYGGTITADGGSYGAGIGGGDEGSAGSVTICGGKITVTGGSDAAGIGGGESADQGGTVTIYGGTVTAEGYGGAGVGGGEDGNGGTLVVYGGKLTARGYDGAAGIGGGDGGTGGNVTIHDGTVGAYGRSYGAGIGGGDGGTGGTVTIKGGTVTAKCLWTPYRGAGIGGGAGADQGGTITIEGGKVRANSEKGAGIGGGYDGDGGTINISGGLVTAQSKDGAGIGGGGSDDIGTLHGGTITISGGVILAASTQKGAGIGGGKDGDCGTVNISGGHVTATGGYFDYDYWQSEMSPDYTAFFKAGAPDYKKAVTAFIMDLIFSGEYGGAGIGGGDDGEGGTVNITGGTVIATAGLNTACAIGHGNDEDENGTLRVYGGAKVTYGTINGSAVQTEGVALSAQRNTIPQEKSFAVIEPCDHPDNAYTVSAETHLQSCRYCTSTFTAKAHIWDENDDCTVCGAHSVSPDRISVTIDDGIGVNFFLGLDDPSRAGVNSVTLRYKDFDGNAVEKTYAKSELTVENGKYKLTVRIAPAQLKDTITVIIGETEIPASVLDYCETLKTGDYEEEVKTVAVALEQYAQAAKEAFNYLPNETITDISGLTAADGFGSWTNTLRASPDMIGKIGSIAFLALTKPEFRFYTPNITETQAAACTVTASFKDGGAKGGLKARFAKDAQDQVLLEVTGLKAQDLGRTVVVTITGLGDTAKRIEFAGYDFAKLMVAQSNTAALGVALYNYGVAASTLWG